MLRIAPRARDQKQFASGLLDNVILHLKNHMSMPHSRPDPPKMERNLKLDAIVKDMGYDSMEH